MFSLEVGIEALDYRRERGTDKLFLHDNPAFHGRRDSLAGILIARFHHL
jgi:hypothetical protein